MQARLSPSFSGKEWHGNQIHRIFVFDFDAAKCPYLWDDTVLSLADYKSRPSLKWAHSRILPKLEALEQGLNRVYSNKVDPVEFLMYLYYKEELTTYEVLERAQKLWLTYQSQSGIQKLFVNSFGWELRDNKEMTERRKKKLTRSNSPALAGLQKSRERTFQENAERFQTHIWDILNTQVSVRPSFSPEYFESIRFNSPKIFYLLECFEWFSFKMFCSLVERTDMWWASLARILNEKLETIHKNNPEIPLLTISPASIHRVLQIAGIKKK